MRGVLFWCGFCQNLPIIWHPLQFLKPPLPLSWDRPTLAEISEISAVSGWQALLGTCTPHLTFLFLRWSTLSTVLLTWGYPGSCLWLSVYILCHTSVLGWAWLLPSSTLRLGPLLLVTCLPSFRMWGCPGTCCHTFSPKVDILCPQGQMKVSAW